MMSVTQWHSGVPVPVSEWRCDDVCDTVTQWSTCTCQWVTMWWCDDVCDTVTQWSTCTCQWVTMWWCLWHSDTVEYLYLSVSDDDASMLHAVGTVAASHVSVTSLSHVDGAVLSTHLLSAPWIKTQHKCGTVLPCSVVVEKQSSHYKVTSHMGQLVRHWSPFL